MIASPYSLSCEQAKNGLEDAQIAYYGAVTSHAEAKRGFELTEALKLCEGVDGKNERERTAKLQHELSEHYTALAEAEDALTEARCAYEVIRLEWETVHYQINTLEIGLVKAGA